MSLGYESGLRVLHVAETIRGGIASYLREILPRQVVRYGEGRVVMIAPEDHLGDLDNAAGVRLVGVQRARSRPGTALRVRQALKGVLTEQPTDVVHVHSSFAGMVCRAPFLKPPTCRSLVYCPHGWGFVRQGKSARAVRSIERWLQPAADAIVCVSEAERTAALQVGLSANNLHVIHNGLPDRELPAAVESKYTHDTLHLLFMGRLDRQKAFDILLAALERSSRSVVVDVFGESVLGEYTAEKVPGSVRMHGWQNYDVIEPLLAACDAVVMPSRWEGLPYTALEAMRAGKAVIASTVGGLVEVVDDGITGVLVPADDVGALARAIDAADRSQLTKMGQAGREKFLAHFTAERMEAELAACYAKCLEQR